MTSSGGPSRVYITPEGAERLRAELEHMIHPYSNATQTRWDHGEFKVQLKQFGNTRPMGFCDGSKADVTELRELAESEGADEMRIEKKVLKSGREIWTLHGGG
jgi:hypothetical protein